VAYNPNQLRCIAQSGIDSGNTWIYGPGDAHATVEGASYFSDGGQRGMRVGDLVFVIEAAAGGTTCHSVSSVAAAQNYNPLLPGFNPPGAATISAGQFA
jgi:hypothetical protein